MTLPANDTNDVVNDGWDDIDDLDDDLDMDDEDDLNAEAGQGNNSQQTPPPQKWHDNSTNEPYVKDMQPQPPQDHHPPTFLQYEPFHHYQEDPWYDELYFYLQQLPHMVGPLNAQLQDAFQDPNKALELVQYYRSRPALAQYTLEKELSRMEYTVELANGRILSEKSDVAAWLSIMTNDNNHDNNKLMLLPRCANQSLLADLMGFFSSPTSSSFRLQGNPDWNMALATQHVSFRLTQASSSVTVHAGLRLQVPHPTQGMLELAQVQVSCHFDVLQPLLHYRVDSIQVAHDFSLPDDNGDEPTEHQQQLWGACLAFWHELAGTTPHDAPPQSFTNTDSWRDVFLQQHVAVWQQWSTTLTNTAAMPSVDLLEQARREEEEAAAEMRPQVQAAWAPSQVMFPRSSAGVDWMEQARLEEEQAALELAAQRQASRGPPPPPPPPPPAPPLDSNQQDFQRPQSILGGMFSRIAKTVHKPPSPQPGMFPRPPPPPPAVPQQEHPTNQGFPRPPPPSFSNENVSSSPLPPAYPPVNNPAPAKSVIPNNSNAHVVSKQEDTEENDDSVGDGWDDDDLLALDQDDTEAAQPQQDKEEMLGTFVTSTIVPENPTVETSTLLPTLVHPPLPEVTDNKNNPDQYSRREPPAPTFTPNNNEIEELQMQDWVYDPETDIIPTRKRWQNPRPGPRRLSQLIANKRQEEKYH